MSARIVTVEEVTAELFAAAQEVDGPTSLLRRALTILQRAAGSDSSVFTPKQLAHRARQGTSLDAVSVDYDLARVLRLHHDVDRYAHELERLHAVGARGRPFLDSDVYRDDERVRLPFFEVLLRPNGIERTLMCEIRFRRKYYGYVVLIRRDHRRRFDAQALARVQALMPAVTLALAATLATAVQPPPTTSTDPLGVLSQREREVARLMSRNLKNKEIARLLGTSPNTVRNQSVRIFEKLGVSGRMGVAMLLHRVSGDDVGTRTR